jgi:hypothetical protein
MPDVCEWRATTALTVAPFVVATSWSTAPAHHGWPASLSGWKSKASHANPEANALACAIVIAIQNLSHAFMPSTKHDSSLAFRLSDILRQLNSGAVLDPQTLAAQFNTSPRTIHRDLTERLAFLDLEKTPDGLYRLPDKLKLGQLSSEHLIQFAKMAGVSKLFASLNQAFVQKLLREHVNSPLLVKGHQYEQLAGKEMLFAELEKAIRDCKQITFIPNVRIISPKELQPMLEAELRGYLDR